jgi:hypothetical protein
MSSINEPLLALFQSHGVEAILQDEWITFPGKAFRANAAIVQETKHSSWISVQLDVRLEIAPNRTILESFGGFGVTSEEAVNDSLRNFTANSFHVLLAAFFLPQDEQVTVMEWMIGGRTARAVLGNVGVRGKMPVSGEEVFAWHRLFQEKLLEQSLSPGTHWVRLYYAHSENKSLACEVLLDNTIWDEMQSPMAAFSWPVGKDFYSVRVFLVLQVQPGGPVRPQTAVAWLAEYLAPRASFTEDEAYEALAEAGVPDHLADRAYKFTQIAWGRVLLDGLGVKFSPEYLWFNAAGEVVESGLLVDEPCFATAMQLVPKYKRAPGFRHLAVTSADVHAVNGALNAGSKPGGLVTSPAALFLATPTDAGMTNARQVIAQRIAAARRSAP